MAGMAKLNQQVNEDMPEAAVPRETQASTIELKAREFRGADRFYNGNGRSGIYRLADGAHLLRLEDFNVTNGPDLRVILSPSENPMNSGDATAPGHVELAKLKGNLGNQNYPIPSDADIASFRSVVIYCKPFRVIFSVAALRDTN